MAEEQDNAQKTEEPTQKRLNDARKKGDAPKSQEMTAAVMLGAGALCLWLLAGSAASGVAAAGAAFLDRPHEFLIDGGALQALFADIAAKLGLVLSGFAMVVFVSAIMANVVQALPVFTTERMKPSFSKISPLKGLKRIFGPSGLFNFVKGVGKLGIIGSILVFALWPDRLLLVSSMRSDPGELLNLIQALTLKLIGLTVAAMAVVAALDYGFQRNAWMKRLRMTREEVKRELKDSEGDPQIKGRQRQQREALARRRMMAAVKDATVLIMNPTHFAVALDYQAGGEKAPVCTAKGVDDLALRMRETAVEHGVPVIENPPLARALFASAALDQEIPIDHYEAVAKIIGFIMRKAKAAPPLR